MPRTTAQLLRQQLPLGGAMGADGDMSRRENCQLRLSQHNSKSDAHDRKAANDHDQPNNLA
jgi:hypothetical protein